jgi:hypothetical protein
MLFGVYTPAVAGLLPVYLCWIVGLSGRASPGLKGETSCIPR